MKLVHGRPRERWRFQDGGWTKYRDPTNLGWRREHAAGCWRACWATLAFVALANDWRRLQEYAYGEHAEEPPETPLAGWPMYGRGTR